MSMSRFGALRTCIPLLVVGSSFGRADGNLVVSESFAYGPTNQLAGGNGGTGWAGPWVNSPLNGSTDNAVTSGGLTMGALVAAGNKLTTRGGDYRSFRRIDTARPEI